MAGIVAACFLKSATFPSNIFMNTINQQAQLNQITWSQVLTGVVGTEYQMLLGNGQWEARSVKSETPQKALKAEIKNEVMQEQRRIDVLNYKWPSCVLNSIQHRTYVISFSSNTNQ